MKCQRRELNMLQTVVKCILKITAAVQIITEVMDMVENAQGMIISMKEKSTVEFQEKDDIRRQKSHHGGAKKTRSL